MNSKLLAPGTAEEILARERERERETDREIERKSESEEIGRLSEGASKRLCERERDLSLGFDDLKRFGSGRDLWFVH
jgi:hypothetical protein